MTVANLPVPTPTVATQAGFDLGGILSNTLNQATNLLGQWGAWEIQSEIAQEIGQIQNIQNQVAQGQSQEQAVPDDAQNPGSGSSWPSWAPTAMFGLGGVVALAVLWKVLK